ncbi:MAG: SurA N-terminal domain-containing protein [Betaproteobacteria bacterium]|nr:SurA N-terminal domain-containing protein [Betaproteobacteria bacterium]
MLSGFRTLSQTWVAKVVLALITIPFALFGVEYYFQQGGAGGAVLKVDGESISQQEFREALRAQQQQMQQNSGGRDGGQEESPLLRYEALNALVNRQLLLNYAKREHLTVPDQLLINEIGRIDVFQDSGKFSQTRYEQVLKSQGMTPKQFEQRLRSDLMLQLEQGSLIGTAWVPEPSLDAFLKLSGQVRTLSSAVVPAETYLPQVKLSSEAAQHYYQSHSDEFRVPEMVDVQYVVLSAEHPQTLPVVTADEIRHAYDDPANQTRWKGQEKRRVRHILLTVPSGASVAERHTVLERITRLRQQLLEHPERFSDIAKTQSQDPGSAHQGGELGFFARGVMTPAFDRAAFALKQGDISEPVETDFGYHLIQVEEIQPATPKTLEQATPELTEELRRQKATQEFSEAADGFGSMVYEQSGSLQPAATRYHLPLQSQSGISQGTQTGIWANQKLQVALFSSAVLKDHRNTQAIEITPGTMVAARVIADHPAHIRPFDEVSGGIQQQLMHQEAARLTRVAGEAMLKDLRAGHAVSSLSWSGERQLSRQQAYAGALPGGAAISPAFQLDEHQLPGYVGATTQEGNYVLIKVTAVQPGSTNDPRLRKEAETALSRAYGDEIMETFLNSLRQGANIQVLDKQLMAGTPAEHP